MRLIQSTSLVIHECNMWVCLLVGSSILVIFSVILNMYVIMIPVSYSHHLLIKD